MLRSSPGPPATNRSTEPDSVNPVSRATAVNPICSTRNRMSQFLNASGSCVPCAGSPSATTQAAPTTDLKGARSLASPSASTVRNGIARAAAHFTNASDGCCARAASASTQQARHTDTAADSACTRGAFFRHVASFADCGPLNSVSCRVVSGRDASRSDVVKTMLNVIPLYASLWCALWMDCRASGSWPLRIASKNRGASRADLAPNRFTDFWRD